MTSEQKAGAVNGGSDLECAEQGWTNTPPTADGHEAPLPIYPTKQDLPQLGNERAFLTVGLLVGIPIGMWLMGMLL